MAKDDWIDVPMPNDFVDVPMPNAIETDEQRRDRIDARSPAENYLRQAGALLPRIGAGVVGGVGGIYGLAETGARMIAGQSPEEAFSKGVIDNPLVKWNMARRNDINEFFDTEEPRTLGEQALFSTLEFVTPIPMAAPAGALSKIGQLAGKVTPQKIAKAVDVGTALLTPIVRIDPTKPGLSAARVATQGGIGIGIDQAVRSYADNPNAPTMLQAAKNEGLINDYVDVAEPEKQKPNDFVDVQINRDIIPADYELKEPGPQPIVYKDFLDRHGFDVAAGMAMAYGAARYGGKALLKKATSANDLSNFGQGTHIPGFETNKFTGIVDRDKQLYSAMEKQNEWARANYGVDLFSKEEMQVIDGKRTFDPQAKTGTIFRTGKLGDNLPTMAESPEALTREFHSLGETNPTLAKEVDTLIWVEKELANRIWATAEKHAAEGTQYGVKYHTMMRDPTITLDTILREMVNDGQFPVPAHMAVPFGQYAPDVLPPATGLFNTTKNRIHTHQELLDMHGNFSQEAFDFADRLRKPFRDMMEYLVDSGKFSRKQADELISNHTLDGRFIYAPEMENGIRATSVIEDLAEKIGFFPVNKEENITARSLRERATSSGEGIFHPIKIDDVYQTYFYNIMKDAEHNRIVRDMTKLLSEMSIVQEAPGTFRGIVQPLGHYNLFDPSGKSPHVITDPANLIKSGIVKMNDAQQNIFMDKNIVKVWEDGVLKSYHIPDDNLFAAVNNTPRALSSIMNLMDTLRRTGQWLNTGFVGNLFAPMSAMYNTFITSITSPAHGGKFNIFLDNIKGFKENMTARAGYTLAATFDRIGELQGMPSPFVSRMSQNMRNAFENSMATRLAEEGHGVASRMDFDSDVSGLLKKEAAYIKQLDGGYGRVVARAVWDLLNDVSDSIKGATRTGFILRNMASTSSDDIAKAVGLANKVEGKMGALSSSASMNAANAIIPYNSVMFQTIDAMARAYQANPLATTMQIFKWVMAPAIAERVYLHTVGTPEQIDRYNKLSTEQKARAHILPSLSGNPTQWNTIGVSPEATPFRAITIAMIDSLLGKFGGPGTSPEQTDHIKGVLKSFGRMLNISTPIPVGVGMNIAGYSMPNGLLGGITPVEKKTGGDAGFYGTEFSGTADETSHTTDAIISSTLMSIGTTLKNIVDAGLVGSTPGKEEKGRQWERGLSYAKDAATDALAKKLPGLTAYTQFNVHGSPLATNVRSKDDNFKHLMADMDAFEKNGSFSDSSLRHDIVKMSGEPAYLWLLGVASESRGELKQINDEISLLNQKISSLKNTSVDKQTGIVLSRNDIKQKLDEYQMQVYTAYGRKHAVYNSIEAAFADKWGSRIDIGGINPESIRRPAQVGQPPQQKNLGM